jgi:predicted Rossmann fold flavoprotein
LIFLTGIQQAVHKYDVIIAGGGPAGILAAGRTAELGGKVLILEKMHKPGRKLLLTGKGRCNITNNAEAGEFIKHIYPKGRFLRTAFSNFFADDIIELLDRYGVETVLTRGGRYFPASENASDVLNALLKWINDLGVEIACGQRVDKLIINNNTIQGIRSNGKIFETGKVILAMGGKSYPATGSNGDGYELARQAGHTIIKPLPALVPLETQGGIAQKMQGLNLKNVKAEVRVNDKKTAEAFGEMLFTHFGLSGPIILTLSRIVVMELRNKNKVEINIDLKPALDEKKLDKRLLRDLNEHGKKKVGNIFRFWLPAAMVPVYLELLNLDPDKACHQVSAEERRGIRYLLKNLRFKVSHNRSFKEAIITAGGVSTSEISSKTMASRLVKGLYFAGEMIDLDADTGGYNLQIAFSTGWLAGNACMK